MTRKRKLTFVFVSLVASAVGWSAFYGFQEFQKMDFLSIHWTCVTSDAKYQCTIVMYRSTEKICGVYIAQVPTTSNPVREIPIWLDIHKKSFPWRLTAKVDGKRIYFKRDIVSVRCTDLDGNAYSADYPSGGFPYIKDGPPFAGDFSTSVDVPGIFAACRNDEQIVRSEVADRPL